MSVLPDLRLLAVLPASEQRNACQAQAALFVFAVLCNVVFSALIWCLKLRCTEIKEDHA